MPSTFTAALGLEKQATGEGSNTWGNTLNDDVIDLIDTAIAVRLALSVAGASDVTLTAAQALNAYHEYTGTLTGNINVIVPTSDKAYIIFNNTSGAFTLTVKTAAGTGVIVPQRSKTILYCDSTNVVGIDTLPNLRQMKGADVASASDLLVNIDGTIFDVTGTTQIDTIATKGIGTVIKLHFDGALILAHDATNLILPGAANITTAAGDEAEFYEYAAADWRCTKYTKASGLPVVVDIVNDTTPQLGGDLDLNGNNIDFPTTANISDCLDEDNMASDSATALSTQQAIKAYVDAATIPDAAKSPPEISNNVTDAAKDIDFAAGYCRAENAAVRITSTAMTKKIDASWVAGTNQGGLSSSLHPLAAAITTLHCFDIVVGGTADCGFDTDPNAANLIADHSATSYRRRCSLKTDATPDLPLFTQRGNKFMLNLRILDVDNSSPGTSANLAVLSVPTGIVVEAFMGVSVSDASVTYLIVTSPDEDDVAPDSKNNDIHVNTTSSTSDSTNLSRFTNTSGQVRYRSSRGSDVDKLTINTLGWIDRRGRDA